MHKRRKRSSRKRMLNRVKRRSSLGFRSGSVSLSESAMNAASIMAGIMGAAAPLGRKSGRGE